MSESTPPSQMIRVPSALVNAVKELSRLHRSGYTSAVLTGLQHLIASIDSTADSVSSVSGGKSDTELLAELIAGLDERIAAQVAVQVGQLEQRMATQLGEHIREGFSRACEVGRELERAKQQSPYPDGKTSESAIGEDAITVNSLDDMALGDIGEVKNASVGNMVEDSPALAAPSSELVEDSKLVPPAPKSQPTRRVIRSNGTENTLKAVNPI